MADSSSSTAPAADSDADNAVSISSSVRDTLHSLLILPMQRALHSSKLRSALLISLVLSSLVAVSLCSSFIAFLALYRSYVPTVGYSAPLELQYGYGRPPFAQVDLERLPAIATDQVYDVFLELVLPPSPPNFNMGNFMVEMEIQASTGASAVKVAKSASMIWTPELVQTVKTLFQLPLYIFFPSSMTLPKQELRIPLVARKALRTFSTGKLAKAVVSIGRQDAYAAVLSSLSENAGDGCRSVAGAGRPQELQIYSATLRIVAHLTGIRRFMYYHRITSFIIFSTLFFLITTSSAIVLLGILSLYRRNARPSPTIPAAPSASGTATPSSSSMEKLLDAERHDAKEESERRARRKEAQRVTGRRMDAAADEEEEESVLRHIKLEDNNDATTLGGQPGVHDDSDEGSSSSGVLVKNEDPQEEGEEGRDRAVKREDIDEEEDNATLLGGSATSVSGSRRSFETRTEASTAASTSTATRSSSLRQRPSSNSLSRRKAKTEEE